MIFGCKSLMVIHLFAMAIGREVRFTNLKCSEFDPSFATIEKCVLKVLQRGVIGLNLHVKLYQIPVSNVSVNVSLLKKLSGYRPFLYNVSADFCKFLKNRKQNPFLKIVVDAMAKDSNINHTCPYEHDIIIHNWVLMENNFKWIPLPDGEYFLKVMVGAYNDWKADIRGFFSLKE